MEPINNIPSSNPNMTPTTDNVAPAPTQPVTPGPDSGPQVPPNTQSGPPEKKSKKKMMLIVLVVLLVLGGAAAAYFATKSKDKTNQPSQQAQSTKKPVNLLTVGVTQPFFTDLYPKIEGS